MSAPPRPARPAIRVETATPAHFEAVESALLRSLNPAISPGTWRRLFEPQWGVGERPLGSVLIAGDRVVGYAAYVHALLPRPNGDQVPLCNVSTWVVDPAYSGQALAVVMPALQLRDTTITNMTPLQSVHEIFVRLGFRELESKSVILRPAPLVPAGWPVRGVETEPARIAPLLPTWEATVARQHGPLVQHLLISGDAGQHCYVMYQLTYRRGLRTAKVHWVTPGALPAASLALRRALRKVSGAWFVELDGRLVPDGTPAMFARPMSAPRLFRSDRLTPAEIPGAFSELVLLDI